MYEDTFGTDWETLSGDAALRRMYALGVAASLGHAHDDEYRRILRQADTAYARSVLQLAFDEGKQRGRRNRKELPDDEKVWDVLVADREAPPASSRATTEDRRPKGSVPKAVTRTSVLEFDSDELERLRIPDLLKRDE